VPPSLFHPPKRPQDELAILGKDALSGLSNGLVDQETYLASLKTSLNLKKNAERKTPISSRHALGSEAHPLPP